MLTELNSSAHLINPTCMICSACSPSIPPRFIHLRHATNWDIKCSGVCSASRCMLVVGNHGTAPCTAATRTTSRRNQVCCATWLAGAPSPCAAPAEPRHGTCTWRRDASPAGPATSLAGALLPNAATAEPRRRVAAGACTTRGGLPLPRAAAFGVACVPPLAGSPAQGGATEHRSLTAAGARAPEPHTHPPHRIWGTRVDKS